jgi:hypothetical protein
MVSMMMTTMTIIPAMVMVVVVVMVPVLRKYLVRVSLGLRLGARCVHRVGGHQQGDRIRDWLEQLRIRPGVQDFSHVLRPHRFHRGRRCKGGDCAHKACDVLVRIPQFILRPRLRAHSKARVCATIPGAATPAAAVEIDRASSTRLWKITE